MTFENYGKLWHIDHTVPCSKFDLKDSEERMKCFHWTNLKPMLAHENRSKNNTLTLVEIDGHENNLQTFLQNLNVEYASQYTIIDIDRTKYIN
jgi:hypothetical protein